LSEIENGLVQPSSDEMLRLESALVELKEAQLKVKPEAAKGWLVC
jgi:hypothetical protein